MVPKLRLAVLKDVPIRHLREEFVEGTVALLVIMKDAPTKQSTGECVGCIGQVALSNQFTEGSIRQVRGCTYTDSS